MSVQEGGIRLRQEDRQTHGGGWRRIFAFILIKLTVVILCSNGLAIAKPGSNDRLVLMWQVQNTVSDEELVVLKRKGVNLVQSFPLITWRDAEIRSYLDRMHKFGFGVVMTVVSMSEKGPSGWSIRESALVGFIRKWRTHPAVFAWHTFDEPSNRGVAEVPKELQERVYGLVKSIDPDHPVMISWNGTSFWHYRFFSEQAFDVLDLHAHITDTVGRRQAALINEFRKRRARDYPVIVTIATVYRPGNKPLPEDAVIQQYRYFFGENVVTRNIGFYGWDLSRNIGIRKDTSLLSQFLDLELTK
ncbi:MAG: hypothetical protein OEW15_03105 [Nitrospirota bacterium]|nr:hypothetical protein [Nitrospirota bacterium]